jgi:hypothetical protein
MNDDGTKTVKLKELRTREWMYFRILFMSELFYLKLNVWSN